MITIKVTGMTCDACVAAVTRALRTVPGVTRVDVSLDKGEITVHPHIDTKPDAAALRTAIEEEGYAVDA
jgi:copper chaperone CopZ